MHVRSASTAPGVAATSFATACDSPVRPDSSTSRSQHSSSRASAGTTSPDSTKTTSPTRSAPADTSSRPPSSGPPRISRCATTSCSSSSDSSTVSARNRWNPLISALPTIAPPTSTASVASPSTAVAAAPVASSGVSGSASSAATVRAYRTGPAIPGTPATAAAAARSRATRSAGVVRCSGARSATRRSTWSGSSACHGVCTVASGSGRVSNRSADQAPQAMVNAVADFPGLVARR